MMTLQICRQISDGGPISLHSTACLAALVIKLWDTAWIQLTKAQSLNVHAFVRYVDDARTVGEGVLVNSPIQKSRKEKIWILMSLMLGGLQPRLQRPCHL